MRALRLIGRGLSDTFEHLLPYTLWSMTWWLALIPIVSGPPAISALFAMTDPRRAIDLPEYREAFSFGRRNFRRGWMVALLAIPIPIVLAWNISYYAAQSGRFGLLVPLWFLMMLASLAIGLAAFSICALTDTSVGQSWRLAAYVTLARPFRALAVVFILLILALLSALLVVPAVLIAPAMIASIVNRWVLDGLGIEVPDPLAPTEERMHEARAQKDAKGSRWRRG